MKGNIILMILALATAIGGGIFMSQSSAEETYSFANIQTPQSCVCSAPADLISRANRNNRYQASRFKSGIKSNLEPGVLLSLYNCQCGEMTCAVTAQAVSCRK